MGSFHKTVLFSAIIILIVSLVLIGTTLANSQGAQTWPPIISGCPDYWIFDGSGNKCVNGKDLGTCQPIGGDKHLQMDFNTSTFTGSQGACNKYKWANKCGVSWDGITYGVDPPPNCST